MDTIQATPIFDRMVNTRVEREELHHLNQAVGVTGFLLTEAHRVIRTWE